MKKKKFLVVKIALILVISIVIGFALYTWNAQTMMGNALPMPFGFGIAEVLTDSMTPEILRGDIIIVVPQKEYKIDDIVAFQNENIVVTHRIIDQNEDGTFITKGDYEGNSADTKPLKSTHIYGKVVKTFSRDGFAVKFIKFVKSPIVAFVILLLAGLLFLLSTRKEKQSDDKELDDVKRQIEALKGGKELTAEDIQAQIDALKKEQEQRESKNNKK